MADGDQNLIPGDDASNDDKRKYADSCTRINVTEPRRIALLSAPSPKILRALASGDYFVHSNGDVIRFPDDFNRRRVTGKVAAGHDKLNDDELDPNQAWMNGLAELDITAFADASHLHLG